MQLMDAVGIRSVEALCIPDGLFVRIPVHLHGIVVVTLVHLHGPLVGLTGMVGGVVRVVRILGRPIQISHPGKRKNKQKNIKQQQQKKIIYTIK